MTANRNLKRRVRARAAKTGESYTTALRHFRSTLTGDVMPESRSLRFAVAQTTVREDPTSSAELRESGAELRRMMREAHQAGARIVHFTEGATCFPSKFVMSSQGPDQVGPSDWSRFEWDVLRRELAATTDLGRELGIWTVLGSVHQLSGQDRPHNSMYVISDQGDVVARYDERTLSTTKITYMYTPGAAPVTFDVDGLRFGCALGMDSHFPELFMEYERLDVDVVLISTTGSVPFSTMVANEALAHAATNSYWASLAVPAQHSPVAPSGVVPPDGEWVAQCDQDGSASLAVVDLGHSTPDNVTNLARTWRRRTRTALLERAPALDATS
ncbi:carbon-nitrogen hydrolase family protein [Actinopolymorpha pittospori]|uniref:Amidohydrolase n=1 Tax=Actinopolymorpha pittospori TaxID=648752 RepID=A0A927RMG9_9ACTN|nr:carbon-nitrogen hydrolase family protein [Actinopolymorpha pittospori]MBE1610171.1 putative amidohydrolase [Actinopolymorpha pittospori]